MFCNSHLLWAWRFHTVRRSIAWDRKQHFGLPCVEAVQGSSCHQVHCLLLHWPRPPDISLPKGIHHPSDLKPTADSHQILKTQKSTKTKARKILKTPSSWGHRQDRLRHLILCLSCAHSAAYKDSWFTFTLPLQLCVLKDYIFAPSAYIDRHPNLFFLYSGYNLKQDQQDFFISADLRKDVVTIWSVAILNHSCHSALEVIDTWLDLQASLRANIPMASGDEGSAFQCHEHISSCKLEKLHVLTFKS